MELFQSLIEKQEFRASTTLLLGLLLILVCAKSRTLGGIEPEDSPTYSV